MYVFFFFCVFIYFLLSFFALGSIFLPLPLIPEDVDADSYIRELEVITDGLPAVMLIHGSQNVVCSEL